MQKFLIAAALVATAANAHAADLPAKIAFKKAPVATTTYDWTGFYAGVNAGLAVGGEGKSGLDVLGLGGSFETFNLASLGVVGGGQAGYNYQFGNWVIGAETDIQGIGTDNHANCILTCNALNGAALKQDMTWFGTVRARLGYATGPILNYFTGGFAYGGVRTSTTERLAGVNVGTFALDQTKTGFTVGSGIEAAVSGNWTAKIEYLYVDLGSTNQAFVLGGVPHVLRTEIRESIFRAGANYRFGGNGSLLAFTPAANWTGFYAGGNGGSGIARDATTHDIPARPISNSFDLAPRGFNGGLQAGYNWQRSNVIYGLETDIQYSTQETDRSCLFTCTQTASATYRQKLDWFGTVRGRIGYGVGPTLFYATGGFAYGEVKTRVKENIVVLGTNGTASFKDVRTGWTLGAGIETPLELFDWLKPGQWSVKIEYLYVDLGSASNSYNLNGVLHTLTTEETNHIFRTGVNYQFDAPVTTKY